MDIPVVLIVIAGMGLFLCSFAGIWFFVTRLLRTMAGMTKKLNVDAGPLVRESSWGSGVVNGVSARGCLRVAEYERGWVVRIGKIFGDGKLWLPKQGASVDKAAQAGLFRPHSLTIHCDKNKVRLTGHLASFVQQRLAGDA